VEWLPADRSSQRSLREFAGQFNLRCGQSDVLFNCAGVQKIQRGLSEDGLEMMFATNYLGHFLPTNLMFDSLRAASESKVITTSGSSHEASALAWRNVGRINLQDLQPETDFSFSNQSKQVVLARLPWYIRAYLNLRCAFMRAQTPEDDARHNIDLATVERK
jgi:NAD(P)-dependent dehydrogenase (short-subunit alcohol dehydrogenase family)